MVLVREGVRTGNNRLHPEITEPVLPALERFLNKILFFPPFFLHRLISSPRNFLPNSSFSHVHIRGKTVDNITRLSIVFLTAKSSMTLPRLTFLRMGCNPLYRIAFHEPFRVTFRAWNCNTFWRVRFVSNARASARVFLRRFLSFPHSLPSFDRHRFSSRSVP